MRKNLLIFSVICFILSTTMAQAEIKSSGPNSLTLNNKTWDKTKDAWNGEISYAIKKVTGTGSSNVFLWTGIHSFADAITDAKAHSGGNTEYLSGDGDWHIWKNCRDFSAAMLTINFARRIFIEKISTKEAVHDLLCVGLIRFVVFNATMKIVKSGFSAYNDPYYNQHALPYWGLQDGRITDKYIATGRTTTPLFDGLAAGAFFFRKTWKF